MSDGGDIVAVVGGSMGGLGALVFAVRWLVMRQVASGEKAVQHVEEERDHKLDEVLTVVQRMERDLAVMGHKLSTQAVEAGELKARIEGMSGNYGGRLGAVESRLAVLESRRRSR